MGAEARGKSQIKRSLFVYTVELSKAMYQLNTYMIYVWLWKEKQKNILIFITTTDIEKNNYQSNVSTEHTWYIYVWLWKEKQKNIHPLQLIFTRQIQQPHADCCKAILLLVIKIKDRQGMS